MDVSANVMPESEWKKRDDKTKWQTGEENKPSEIKGKGKRGNVGDRLKKKGKTVRQLVRQTD